MEPMHWRNGSTDLFQDFENLQDEINRLFEVTRVPESRGIFERTFSPAVDVVENPDAFEVLCDVPGMEIGDMEISIAGSVLTIKGEKKTSVDKDEARTYREEMRAGRFQRTLQLPLAVDSSRVDAVLKDGVLMITLPKQEELKPRQIAVKAR
ncbi:MAG TPA: Hsp20/alpha crystallin family protein [Spirochaetia bacterium]|nr:Hsp20/alpha crystallin family protein [Spirochaetia bacterium]